MPVTITQTGGVPLEEYLKAHGLHSPSIHVKNANGSATIPVEALEVRGEASLTDQVKDALKSAVNLTKVLTGAKCSPEELARRQALCEACPYTDDKGEKLYRFVRAGQPTCGLIRTASLLRDSQKKGCGCLLKLKWQIQDQHCPNGAW